jgi:hypothetical protein
MATLCLVQKLPCFNDIAPYWSILATDAHASIVSLYRGDDARALLNKYGHHSQTQLADATPAQRAAWGILGTPNAPGHSTHELRSDGAAFPSFPSGAKLPWWCQGADVPSGQVAAMMEQAAAHKWELFRPYDSGAELHHVCFRRRPSPTPHTIARIYRLRRTLPRS